MTTHTTQRDAIRARDAGLALVLLCLLAERFLGVSWAGTAAIVVVVAVMVWPGLFKPFARVWFGLSEAMGAVVSRILLGLVFFLVVTPMGLLRRLAGKDPMRLKAFGRGDDTAFTVRDQAVEGRDLERMF
jgi:ABC-type uncharacterized transport system permease subunit